MRVNRTFEITRFKHERATRTSVKSVLNISGLGQSLQDFFSQYDIFLRIQIGSGFQVGVQLLYDGEGLGQGVC